MSGGPTAASLSSSDPRRAEATRAYRRRAPEPSPLYQLVRTHLETFLAHARECYAKPLPRYVVDTFRAYLRCGILAHGFLRAHCDGCGHDLLVAFSCKGRGLCPSCGGRRMCNEAAHLVDRVLPNVPVRQWVLSLPFPIRRLAAFDANVLRGLVRIFVDTVLTAQRGACGFSRTDDARGGAITFVQRFGGSLNLNVHLHVMVLDGVFTRDAEGRPHFHDAPPPERAELQRIVRTVHRRALRWLRARGHLDARNDHEDDAHDDGENVATLDACAAVASASGGLVIVADDGTVARTSEADADDHATFEHRDRRFSAAHEGFDLHAAVRIGRDDDVSRERLVRYCARPSFAIDRFSRLRDGRIAFRVKHGRRGGTHRVMAPLDAMARLAALIPPPRFPLVRYHGVLAPNAAWRKAIVPRPSTPARDPPCAPERNAAPVAAGAPARSAPAGAKRQRSDGSERPRSDARAVAPITRTDSAALLISASSIPSLPRHVGESLSDPHVRRLLDGLLLANSRRLDWARLLRRSLDLDALQCPRCPHRLRVIAAITDPAAAHSILEHAGLAAQPPPVARARDPSDESDDADLGVGRDAHAE